MKKLFHAILLATLAVAVGLHWPVIQGAAWIGMFVRFSQQHSLRQSAVLTFGGENPCRYCRFVQAHAQPETRDSPKMAPEIRLFDLFPAEIAELPVPVEADADDRVDLSGMSAQRTGRPMVPPPRAET